MDLSDPKTLRNFLDRHGLSARKGLGQHFLCSGRVVSAIVGRLAECRGILEIGPGPGVLTAPLSASAQALRALEVDDRMISALRESAPQAKVWREDALESDLRRHLEELPRPRAVVSNLPYYITGPLLTRIAEVREFFDMAVLMMQAEVGTRILAPAGNRERGSISVFLQLQFEIRKVAEAPAGSFLPPPKVDSIVLQFDPKALTFDPALFDFVRKSFRQPRKTLANNLFAMGFDRDAIAAAMRALPINERARPADLELEQWQRLFQATR